ncbi:YIP1 family protein [Rubellimicrobium arenae]|uniref:YIP1 family protein n=1 Tax=Rubellimicrobium arenae TaxID=2817372 RepID=UPI0034A3757B
MRTGPRAVIREHLARGENEARALAFLMIGCILVFVSQWPRLARTAQLEGDEFPRLAAYALLGWLMIWPLVFYALAGVVHTVSRLTGGQGTAFGARLALFWSWLAASPLALLTGILAGFTGASILTNLAGLLWILVFIGLWWRSQGEAARGPQVYGVQ